MTIGIIYGISVGPGDSELITIKGLRIIQSVSVVAFPAGIGDKQGIAETIISPWLKPNQHKLALEFPYVRDETILKQAWLQAANQVLPYLQQGIDVAFACEGDISFYSTFTYLAQTLQQIYPQVKIEFIPGVSSPLAAASGLGLPLVTVGASLIVLPAIYNIKRLKATIEFADVVVLLKVNSVYHQVWEVLNDLGLLDSAYVIEKATLPDEVIYRGLRNLPNLKLSYFSLLIVTK